ncbi:alpha-amylase family glycosyl hydrolase [Clostridium felsineum]|uniref:alpha-amylase family glycosyl hydrolase n=1 Tax=Clostridium felsineum TaxID=36839 RepID=UPI00098C4337|nr:alpha-amylase family glycosyl hydrolase [Clostridium felsineum]URZ15373.1 Cyclomaltodextrinase [Clostridium felsineum DSM 794]
MTWTKNAIFYHIYPLGLCDAPLENDFTSKPIERLKEIEDWIPHLKSLGINALYLGPVFESTSHGYDTADYFTVDRRLGTNATLKKLITKLHKNGIKIVLDGVFNHVGRNFPQFLDVLQNKGSSPFASWFSGINFNGNTPYNDGFSYDTWGGHYNLVKLNFNNGEVKNLILKIVDFWIKEFKIDGLRLDAADCIDLNFLKELSKFCKSKSEEFFLLGEIIFGDYSRWANKDTLDSVTNYEAYKGLYSSHNSLNYFEIAYSLNREFGEGGIYKDLPLYNFIDNHDVNRIASTLTDIDNIYPTYALLLTMPGIPSIYYGSEFAIKGTKQNNSDKDLRPALKTDIIKNSENKQLIDFIKVLCKLRVDSEALAEGLYKQLFISNKQFAFLRYSKNEKIIVALNCSKECSIINFQNNLGITSLLDVLNEKTIKLNLNDNINIDLKENEARIFKVMS